MWIKYTTEDSQAKANDNIKEIYLDVLCECFLRCSLLSTTTVIFAIHARTIIIHIHLGEATRFLTKKFGEIST